MVPKRHIMSCISLKKYPASATTFPPSVNPPLGLAPVTTGSSSNTKFGRTRGSVAVVAAVASSSATVATSCPGGSHSSSAEETNAAGPYAGPNLHRTSGNSRFSPVTRTTLPPPLYPTSGYTSRISIASFISTTIAFACVWPGERCSKSSPFRVTCTATNPAACDGATHARCPAPGSRTPSATCDPNRHFGDSEGCASGRCTTTRAPPVSGNTAGNAPSTPDCSWYVKRTFPPVKSFWLVDTRTGRPVRASAGVGFAAGATHSMVVALFHTPVVSIVPILHLSRLVLAKFRPSTVTAVPPLELPVRGNTDLVAAVGVYWNSTSDAWRPNAPTPLDTSTGTACSLFAGASHRINVEEMKCASTRVAPTRHDDDGLKSSPRTSITVPASP